MDQSNKLSEYIMTIGRFMKGEMSFDSGKSHLTLIQLQTLLLLKERGEMKMQDITEHFKVTKPTSTSLLNKLVRSGLVKRTSGIKDKRVVKVSLTKEGEELFRKAQLHREKKLSKLLSYLSEKEKTNLISILQKLSNAIRKENP